MYNKLIKACKNGDIENVKRILNEGKTVPSFHKNRAIQYTSQNGHSEVVKLLKQDKRVQKQMLIEKIEKL